MLNKRRASSTTNPNVKAQLVAFTATVMNKIGLCSAYGFLRSRLVGSQSVIIAYHRIGGVSDYPWSLTPTTPRDFEKEIGYLRERYVFASLEEVVTSLQASKTIPPRTAVITFDDGYKDVYLNAYPVLKKNSIPATVFLSTDYIDTRNLFWWDIVGYVIWQTKLNSLDFGGLGTYRLGSAQNRIRAIGHFQEKLKSLADEKRREAIDTLVRTCDVAIPPDIGNEHILSWDEIREMGRNGISFGAHTATHPILTRMPLENARQEIIASKQRIETELGQEVVTFCYPNGEIGDLNRAIEEILEKDGFKCAVIVEPFAFLSGNVSRFRLPRISVDSNYDLFTLVMSGLYLDLVQHRRREER